MYIGNQNAMFDQRQKTGSQSLPVVLIYCEALRVLLPQNFGFLGGKFGAV